MLFSIKNQKKFKHPEPLVEVLRPFLPKKMFLKKKFEKKNFT
jgi:hypothetical protein